MHRAWVTAAAAEAAQPPPPRGSTHRVFHMNVLADCLASDFDESTPPETLAWHARSLRLLGVIEAAGWPDLVALAECDHHEDFWCPRLKAAGYEAVAYSVVSTRAHGVALFANATRYTVRGCMQARVAFAAAALVCRRTLTTFVLAATHLKAEEAGAEERAVQMRAITDNVLAPLVHLGLPVVFTGDFNAPADEFPSLPLAHVCALSWTTYKRRPPTAWQGGGTVRRAIDHFFVTPRTVTPLRFLDVPAAEPDTPLPGTLYPSDHLAIVADFAIV